MVRGREEKNGSNSFRMTDTRILVGRLSEEMRHAYGDSMYDVAPARVRVSIVRALQRCDNDVKVPTHLARRRRRLAAAAIFSALETWKRRGWRGSAQVRSGIRG